jgi:hypothetical protein
VPPSVNDAVSSAGWVAGFKELLAEGGGAVLLRAGAARLRAWSYLLGLWLAGWSGSWAQPSAADWRAAGRPGEAARPARWPVGRWRRVAAPLKT